MKIHFGQFRHEIYYSIKTLTTQGSGAKVPTYTEGSAVFANVRFKLANSDEDDVGTRVQAFTTCEIDTRYDSTIDETTRVRFKSDEFNILAIIPDPTETYMTLKCVKDAG